MPDNYHTILELHRNDIGSYFEDEPHLQEAVAFLSEEEIRWIAKKVGSSLMEGGDYHLAVKIWSKDSLAMAFTENEKEITKRVLDKRDKCPVCSTNPDDGKGGMCDSCLKEYNKEVHRETPEETKP